VFTSCPTKMPQLTFCNVQASVVECDGHELFRESSNAQAVVVLIRECTGLTCHLPMPGELASSLRGQRSLEELGGD